MTFRIYDNFCVQNSLLENSLGVLTNSWLLWDTRLESAGLGALTHSHDWDPLFASRGQTASKAVLNPPDQPIYQGPPLSDHSCYQLE